jgi:hypothetical protein
MSQIALHAALAAVVSLHFILGDKVIAQSTAVAVGISQFILFCSCWVMHPVLSRRPADDAEKSGRAKQSSGDDDAISIAKDNLCRTISKLWHARRFFALWIGALTALVSMLWLCQSNRLLWMTAALLLGGMARWLFNVATESDETDHFLAQNTAKEDSSFDFGDLDEDPHSEAFWSDLLPSTKETEAGEKVPTASDILAEIYLTTM